jgi:excisionase family DNA binding protein
MPRTKPKPGPIPHRVEPVVLNGSIGDILTLTEAAEYLRLPEQEVILLVREHNLPARRAGKEWRFFKTAIQNWLSEPLPRYGKEAQLAVAGAWKDDPYAEEELKEIYKRRGRPMTED